MSDCAECGTEFEPTKHRVKFCCRSCSCQHTAKHRKSRTPTYAQAIINFWANVKKTNGCWFWLGKRCGNYGRIWVQGKSNYAHVFSHKLNIGEITNGLFVLHKCDNPLCVRPDHLYAGTAKNNVDDMWRRGRARPRKGLVVGIAQVASANPLLVTGEANGNSKLTEIEVRQIREKYALDPRRGILEKLGNEYGVCANLIGQIVKRKRWAHVK